ncbi:MAG TPA: M48 family metalloprotease, partial [Nevskiaceae bacterium]
RGGKVKRLRAALAAASAVALLWQGTAMARLPFPEALPNLGQPADAKLSPQKAQAMSNQDVAEMYAANYIVTDPQLQNLIDSVGWRLAVNGTMHPPAFRFLLLASSSINAETIPGTTIGVNVGSIAGVANVSELASVLAHEEAHVTQNHIARRMARPVADSLARWAGVLAVTGAALATGSGGQAAVGGLLAGESVNAQSYIDYTRRMEMGSDRVEVGTLERAGYNPVAMADLFRKLEKQSQLYGYVPPAFDQTPPLSARIAQAAERAEEFHPVHLPFSISFALMRARARVLEANLPSDALVYFHTELDSGHATPGNRYGYAMALHELDHNRQALTALRPLLAAWPGQRNVLLLESRIYRGLDQTPRAVRIDEQVLHANPDYEPAILRTAADLIADGRPRRARGVLLDDHPSYGSSPRMWQLMARADLALHNKGDAAFDMSNYYIAREQTVIAVRELDAGLRLGSISAPERARLEARRQQLLRSMPAKALQALHQSETPNA